MMRDYEKEVERYSLEEEMRMMEDLEEIFQEASVAIQGKIKNFLSRSDANETHVQNQLDIQNARLAEISAIIALLQTKEFETIDEFLHTSYEIGFTGTLYGLQKQGIPLLFPIDQRQVANAMIRSSKLIKDLRSTVNMNSKVLQSAVRTELAKGIAMGSSYAEIARGIDRKMNTGMKVAMRIARTEGARINQESRFDAAKKAKEAGADLVKQWDSTLDGRTRPTHRKLDGQIRELDEPFEVDGKTAQHPCGFGIASEDINCRCIMLTRARWALEDEEQNSFTKNVEGEIVEFENRQDYENFKANKYPELAKNDGVVANFKGADYQSFVDSSKEILNNEAELKLVEEREKLAKSNPNLYPETLVGVKRGKAMTFAEADGNKVNPNFNDGFGYKYNCQSCVIVHEARLRGYNLETLPNYEIDDVVLNLMRNPALGWKVPETGQHPTVIHEVKSTFKGSTFKKYLNELIKPNERYTMQYFEKSMGNGHILCVDKTPQGFLRIYDPQTGFIAIDNDRGNSPVDLFLAHRIKYDAPISVPTSVVRSGVGKYNAALIRVDNLEFNDAIMGLIAEEASDGQN